MIGYVFVDDLPIVLAVEEAMLLGFVDESVLADSGVSAPSGAP
jgi:hypothetical protein